MPVMDSNDWSKPLSEAEQLSKQLKSLSVTIQGLADEEQRLAELQEIFEKSDREYHPIEIAGHGIDITKAMAVQLIGEAHARKGTELMALVVKYRGMLNDQ